MGQEVMPGVTGARLCHGAHLGATLVGFWGAEVMLSGIVCQGSEHLSSPHLRRSILGGQVARGTRGEGDK